MTANAPTKTHPPVSHLVRCERASTLTTFAVALPVLLGVVAMGIDYAGAAFMKTKMQRVADDAAVMSARQLQLATSTADKVSASAQSYVAARFGGATTTVDVDTKALTVRVQLDADVDPLVPFWFLDKAVHLTAAATAKLSSGLPLCLLALDNRAAGTLNLEASSLLTAPSCLVYSDSKSSQGIMALSNSVLTAGFVCTAGGKITETDANITPQPATDCPAMPDPLAGRPPPLAAGCDHLLMIVPGGSTTLQPGVYCGGLIISLGANVTMAPGVYTIKDGPFLVNGNATLTGKNVSIYLQGLDSNLKFDTDTTISLSAPKDGPMAGILMYDDPTGATALLNPLIAGKYYKLLSPAREHLILSNNARTLIGTIYMPKGRLIIDANKPVADKSDYTVLVVDQLDLYSGPNLILNSDYGASEIPVPAGVGNYGGTVALTN